jgi:hypothetical protein
MKKNLLGILAFLTFLLFTFGMLFAESYSFTGVNLAASSTNSSASEVYNFEDTMTDGFRLSLSGIANAGTTNGSLSIVALTSYDGTTWDTFGASTNSAQIKLTLTAFGQTVANGTNSTSDFYIGSGVKKIKFVYLNQTPGSWTNVFPTISYRKKNN